jgi:TRAP transporter T-component
MLNVFSLHKGSLQADFIMIKPRIFLLLCLTVLAQGCSIADKFAKNLSVAVLENNDPQIVADGLPAYLLLLDSMIVDDPEDGDMLRSAASLNSAYGLFVKEPDRQKLLADKALNYASQAICLHDNRTCQLTQQNFKEVEKLISTLDKGDITMLYTFGATWASWIQVNNSDWNAIAKIAQVKLIMSKVLQLDETFEHAGAHLYMGVLNSLLPKALGGKPELGKQHFEKAIKLSNNTNLMAKVLYAQHYARLMFDQPLHDRLLNEVLQAKASTPGMTLINTLAQKQASELLKSSTEYF